MKVLVVWERICGVIKVQMVGDDDQSLPPSPSPFTTRYKVHVEKETYSLKGIGFRCETWVLNVIT